MMSMMTLLMVMVLTTINSYISNTIDSNTQALLALLSI